MHIDANELQDGALIEGDICIVGAGAAGIAMALEWVDDASRVILLEGGGFEYEPQMQELYRGNQNLGEPYFPLETARLHFFGGTTGHWAGFCSPFDDIDFQTRSWVPSSGWPITRQDLDPYYARTQPLLELGPYEYDAAYWETKIPELQRLALGDSMFTKIWQFSPPTRFGTRYRSQIVRAGNVHLFTHANVVELQANTAASTVERLRVKSPGGGEFFVRARHVVLACGAIQNARLLLASNAQASAGLGNDHDLVGRYFMEHLEMPAANLLLQDARLLKLYATRERIAGVPVPARGELALTAATQEQLRVLNGTAEIQPGFHPQALKSSFQTYTPDLLQTRNEQSSEPEQSIFEYVYERILWRLFPEPSPEMLPQRDYQLFTRQEQAPNPDSRVTLDFTDLDALGLPRVNLDWRLTRQDKDSMRRYYEHLGRVVGEVGLGRLQILDWLLDDDPGWPDFLSGGWHHMGTTRMHASPAQGVVDAECRVHGVDNLYVAGSGPFTTSGAANPTLTLVALSLRLSDHLKHRVQNLS